MAKFSYRCQICGYEESLVTPVRPKIAPNCTDSSHGSMERYISGTSAVVITGASYRNGYSVPQSNSDLGLPTEHEMMKYATQNAEAFMDHETKDLKKDYDTEKAKVLSEVRDKAEKIKHKNPELYTKFKEAQDRLKSKKSGKV